MRCRIDSALVLSLFAAALLCALTACGAKRTAAATQPTPAAFDPATSDAKALAAVDTMLGVLGGADAWEQVKQIRWETKYYQNGEWRAWFKHAWDRWNGRHRMETVNMVQYLEAEQAGRSDDARWILAMYDLFDREGRAYALFDGEPVMDAERPGIVADAYEQWKRDAYQLTMLYKLRDPGVKLGYVGEIQDVKGNCMPGCVVVKVSFVPEVGADTYFININKETNLPEVLEKQVEGGTLGYAIDGWLEVGAMRFPQKLVNLGVDEIIEMSNVQVGEPEASLYVPPVER